MGYDNSGKNSVRSYTLTPRTTKRLSAAKSIRDILTLVEELEELLDAREQLDQKINALRTKIETATKTVSSDPSFDIIKEYIIRR